MQMAAATACIYCRVNSWDGTRLLKYLHTGNLVELYMKEVELQGLHHLHYIMMISIFELQNTVKFVLVANAL